MGDNMIGKILKVSNNDLKGNVDDRRAAVYAAFKHVKYMNRYIVYSFVEEYAKNKLYVGSVHLKDKSLVVFEVRQEELAYINKFVTDLMNNQLDSNEYEIIDISNMEKIELVSSTEEDFTGLVALDKLTIEPDVVETPVLEPKKKKPIFLYFLLLFFILLLGGVTYLYLNPNVFDVELKMLDCTTSGYNKKMEASYKSGVIAKFDKRDELINSEINDVYKFKSEEVYKEFKDNNGEEEYFRDAKYEYNDDDFELKVVHENDLAIISYEEVLKYLKSKGYSCIEGIYNEE